MHNKFLKRFETIFQKWFNNCYLQLAKGIVTSMWIYKPLNDLQDQRQKTYMYSCSCLVEDSDDVNNMRNNVTINIKTVNCYNFYTAIFFDWIMLSIREIPVWEHTSNFSAFDLEAYILISARD